MKNVKLFEEFVNESISFDKKGIRIKKKNIL